MGDVRLFLAAVLLAGCAAVAPLQEATYSASPIDMPPAVTWQAQGCSASLLGVFPPYDETVAWLPSGFRPREARDLLGSPVDFGRAMAVVGILHCPAGSNVSADPINEVSIGILVQSPVDDGQESFDFYDVAHTSDGWLAQAYEDLAWDVHVAPALWQDAMVEPVPFTGTLVDFEDAGGSGTLRLTGTLSQDEAPWTARFWRWHPDGLRSLDLQFAGPWRLGAVSCAFEATSWAAQVTGITNCAAAEDMVLGFYWPPFDLQARLGSEAPQ